jgi:hypothetical protein
MVLIKVHNYLPFDTPLTAIQLASASKGGRFVIDRPIYSQPGRYLNPPVFGTVVFFIIPESLLPEFRLRGRLPDRRHPAP